MKKPFIVALKGYLIHFIKGDEGSWNLNLWVAYDALSMGQKVEGFVAVKGLKEGTELTRQMRYEMNI